MVHRALQDANACHEHIVDKRTITPRTVGTWLVARSLRSLAFQCAPQGYYEAVATNLAQTHFMTLFAMRAFVMAAGQGPMGQMIIANIMSQYDLRYLYLISM